MAGRIGRLVYGTKRWRRVRLAVLRRDGYRCVKCGKSGVLEVHHRTALADGGAIYDASNLESVCLNCHRATHAAPISADEADWLKSLVAVHGC